MNNAVEVRNLSKSYRSFRLENISFNIPKGYVMGLVGQNGSGKSTTMKAILGMIKYDGECLIWGESANKTPNIKENIGVVFDELFFMPHLTPLEIESQLKPFYSNWDSTEYRRLLNEFDLPPKKKSGSFSRGMRMKLMLAAALSHNAELLILDEPTSGLDPVARDELLDILYDYISDGEKSILFSTHITADLEKIADYITIINNGRILCSGIKDDLLEEYVIIKGDTADISETAKESIIGFSPYRNGFSGMIKREDISEIPEEFDREKPSIDDILVYLTKDKKRKSGEQ